MLRASLFDRSRLCVCQTFNLNSCLCFHAQSHHRSRPAKNCTHEIVDSWRELGKRQQPPTFTKKQEARAGFGAKKYHYFEIMLSAELCKNWHKILIHFPSWWTFSQINVKCISWPERGEGFSELLAFRIIRCWNIIIISFFWYAPHRPNAARKCTSRNRR